VGVSAGAFAGTIRCVADRTDTTGRWTGWQPLRLAIGCALGAALALGATGCQNQKLAEQRSRTRIERLEHTTQIWAASERGRPAKTVQMLRHGEWYIQHQTEELDRNGREAGRLIEREFRRPEDRGPALGEWGLKLLYGKPERIERNAIILFF